MGESVEMMQEGAKESFKSLKIWSGYYGSMNFKADLPGIETNSVAPCLVPAPPFAGLPMPRLS